MPKCTFSIFWFGFEFYAKSRIYNLFRVEVFIGINSRNDHKIDFDKLNGTVFSYFPQFSGTVILPFGLVKERQRVTQTVHKENNVGDGIDG